MPKALPSRKAPVIQTPSSEAVVTSEALKKRRKPKKKKKRRRKESGLSRLVKRIIG